MRLRGMGLGVALLGMCALETPSTIAQHAPAAGGVERPAAEPLWKVSGEGRGRPAMDTSHVYFLSKRHEVLAVDIRSGSVCWKQITGAPGDTTFGPGVVISGEVVAAGDFDVTAFDRQTGALRWRFVPADGYGVGPYLGASAGGLIFTGSPTGRLHALDDRTGRPRWTVVVGEDDKTTVFGPEADGDVVVAGYTKWAGPNTGGLVAIDTASGRERWRVSFPRPEDPALDTNSAGNPLFVDDVVIAASGDGTIYAFDRENGTQRWSIPRLDGPLEGTVVLPERDFRVLARSGRTLLAGSLTGYTTAYDLDTRRELWRYSPQLHASVASGIVADDRFVYVPHFAGTIVIIDLADGHEVWRLGNWRRGFNWPPLVSGERLYAAASYEGFFAFDRTGRSAGGDR